MSDPRPRRSFWLNLGLTSFGGPLAQIAALEQECVPRRGWFTAEQFARALGLCMFLPGPEAQQMIAWIAWKVGGWREAAVASLLFIGPGLVCCGLLAVAYAHYGALPLVSGALDGARAAVAGVILVSGYRLVRLVLKDRHRLIAAGFSFAGLCFGAPFVMLALSAAVFGWYFHPGTAGASHEVSSSLRTALRRMVRYLLPFALVLLLLWACLGRQHGLVRLAEVSFVALLASFGGAYAALGIWRARVTGSYGWMTESRFGDSLVIGEATPGPLLLAGSFVGCVAGLHGQLGLPAGWYAGVIGLLIPAFFTFGPSTALLLATASLADEGLADSRLDAAIGMATAVGAAAVLWLGTALFLNQHGSPAMMLTSFAAGWVLLKGYAKVPVIVITGAVLGWFLARS